MGKTMSLSPEMLGLRARMGEWEYSSLETSPNRREPHAIQFFRLPMSFLFAGRHWCGIIGFSDLIHLGRAVLRKSIVSEDAPFYTYFTVMSVGAMYY